MTRNQPSPSSHSHRRRIGRVHSPTFLKSVHMTYTAVRNRFGRTMVTWLGIVLGIAFLMSTLLTANIRGSLQNLTERRTSVQSMMAILRAEIGATDGKKIVIATAEPTDVPSLLEDFVGHLKQQCPKLQLVGPLSFDRLDRDETVLTDSWALIVWLPDEQQQIRPDGFWQRSLATMKQPVILAFGNVPTFESMTDKGIRVRNLLPAITEKERTEQQEEQAKAKTRMRWLIVVSLLVAAIGISNALLMSVTERYREIGTMKCLGAMNGFIIRLILMESSLLGALGAVVGIGLGTLLALGGYSSTYGVTVVLSAIDTTALITAAVLCLAMGCLVAVVAAIYPAWTAVRMIPADALRTEI